MPADASAPRASYLRPQGQLNDSESSPNTLQIQVSQWIKYTNTKLTRDVSSGPASHKTDFWLVLERARSPAGVSIITAR